MNQNVSLLWKEFKGIRKLHSINSDSVLGADIAHNVRLTKEKSGEARSIRSSGWFHKFTELNENVIRLFSANFSGYGASDQLVAFTKVGSTINAWIILDSTANSTVTKIATFTLVSDVTDVCMTQWGDRLGMVVAFGASKIGFVFYSADANIPDTTQMGTSGFFYREVDLTQTAVPIDNVTRVCPYRSRLAVNGVTSYSNGGNRETIYGVWFSEAGNLLNFTDDPITSATETSAFYVETGEYVNSLEEYHGLTAFCRNRSYNITGTSQNDIEVLTLTSKGVFGNATFTINGKCAYIDSWAKNIFTLRDNIDGTIGFDDPVGNEIQDYIDDVTDVTVNTLDRRVRLTKQSGQTLVYDVDIQEWTEETFMKNSRTITFLNAEYFCCGDTNVYIITDKWTLNSIQMPNENGYYSHYRTNLIWLDSQSSVKSHLYPFAIIMEPNTLNNFRVKFTTDRGKSFDAPVTKAGFENIATYSADDSVPLDGSHFVDDDHDISGRVFFSLAGTELLVTVDRPPFWRYLQIDIYTLSQNQQFNISGVEAKNTVITNEMLEY